MEYVYSLDSTHKDAIILAGHGILARSAMLATGYNDDVGYVIANGLDSRPMPYDNDDKISAISFYDNPHLYCPAFAEMPFGNECSALLSLCIGKSILMASAEDGASNNLVNKIIPTAKELKASDIYYHTRPGSDYLSREDWNIYLDIIDSKIGRKTSI
ncbi:MAG: hypothetical protein J6V80_01215 [Clostridia bacterium]|nr:hypothetical protein [Clostridia bacterium]